MAREGSDNRLHHDLAGTPATTVTMFSTGLMTTEPAAMRAQCPTSILPRIGAGADHHAAAYFRMAVLVFLPVPPSVTSCRIDNVIFDYGSLTDHKSGGMVEENAAADFCRRVDIALEY
jgi:hypothetical protein